MVYWDTIIPLGHIHYFIHDLVVGRQKKNMHYLVGIYMFFFEWLLAVILLSYDSYDTSIDIFIICPYTLMNMCMAKVRKIRQWIPNRNGLWNKRYST